MTAAKIMISFVDRRQGRVDGTFKPVLFFVVHTFSFSMLTHPTHVILPKGHWDDVEAVATLAAARQRRVRILGFQVWRPSPALPSFRGSARESQYCVR